MVDSDKSSMLHPASPMVTPVGPRRRSRHRHWLRLLLIVVGAVIVLALAGPKLLSTSSGRRALLRIVNSRIAGTATLDQLDLSWFGSCRASGLALVDEKGRQNLSVGEVTYSEGLLHAITNPTDIGNIGVKSASATVRLDERPAGASDKLILPLLPVGQLVMENCSVLLVNSSASYELSEIDANVNLRGLEGVTGNLSLKFPRGAKLSARVEVAGLGREMADYFQRGRANLVVSMEGAVDLKALAPLLMAEGLEGLVSVDRFQGSLDAAKFSAVVDAGVSGFRWPGRGLSVDEAIDLQLAGNAEGSANTIAGTAELASQAGMLAGTFSFDVPSDGIVLPSGLQLAEVLTGGPLPLPEFALDINGRVDLAVLARSAPAMLSFGRQAAITDGVVLIQQANVSGGSLPSILAELDLSGLRVRKDAKEIPVEPVSLSVDAAFERASGLNVRKLSLSSKFLQAQASGKMAELSGNFHAELEGLDSQLAGLVALPVMAPSGTVNGTMKVKEAGEGISNFSAALSVSDLSFLRDDTRVALTRGKLAAHGQLVTIDGKLGEAIVDQGKLELGSAATAAGSGRYDIGKQAFSVDIESVRADLALLDDLLQGASVDLLEGWSGVVIASSRFKRGSADGPVEVSAGNAKITGLAFEAKAVSDGGFDLQWSGLDVNPAEGDIRVDSASVAGKFGEVSVSQVHAVRLAPAQIDGTILASVELSEALVIARAISDEDLPSDVSGLLAWEGRARTSASGLDISGAGRIDGFQVGDQRQNVNFSHDVLADQKAQSLTVRSLSLSSDVFSTDISGTVSDHLGECVLDLAGSYQGDWDKLLAVVHGISPDSKDLVSISGKTSGNISMKGPVRGRNVRPQFAGLVAVVPVGWQNAEVMGLKLSAGKISPTLDGGVVRIPETEVPAGTGKVRLVGAVDLTQDHPSYVLSNPVVLLDNLPVTAQLSRELLSRFNPVFADLTTVSGTVSLSVDDLLLPLDQTIRQSGRGSGHLDLSQLQARPEGLLAELLRLAGGSDMQQRQMEVRGVDFQIRNGRIHYDKFALVFSEELDLQFNGSVGFDDTLDLAVSVPISLGVLEKLGVGGPLADYTRVLAGTRIAIPVAGTRLRPSLDFSGVGVAEVVRRAVKLLLTEKAGDILGDVLKDQTTAPDTELPKQSPADSNKNEDIEVLLDSLLDVIRDKDK